MSIATSVVEAVNKQADKIQSEKGAGTAGEASGAAEAAARLNQNAGAEQNQQAAPAAKTLTEIFKERGIQIEDNISDDEILNRIKGTGSASSATQQQLAEPDYNATEDEVLGYLQTKGKDRDYLNRVKAQQTMADFDLVKLHYKAELSEKNPGMTEDELDTALKQQFSISDQADEFSDLQRTLGQAALTNEANRIRMTDGMDLEDAEFEITETKKQQHAQKVLAQKRSQEIAAFLPSMPKELTFPVGKLGEIELGDMVLPITPDVSKKITAILHDPSLLRHEFTNPDTKAVDYAQMTRMLASFFMTQDIARSTAHKFYSLATENHAGKLNNKPDLTKVGVNGGAGAVDLVAEAEAHNKKVASQMFGKGVR